MIKSVFVIVILYSTAAFPVSCSVIGKLLEKYPKLAEDREFWSDVAHANKDEVALRALTEKYMAKSSSSAASEAGETAVASISPVKKIVGLADLPAGSFSFSTAAQSAYKKLEEGARKKLHEFLEVMSKPDGLNEVRLNPHKWRLEKMREGGWKGTYSIRLNDGSRAIFSLEDGVISIRGLGSQIYHH